MNRATDMSQNEQAYEQLRQALTTLVYKPGDYLSTASLMDELALGRTPINHALHRLATEGLVQVIPRKGVIVAPLSINDALELVDVRMANEALCMRLAAERITKAEVTELRRLAREFDQAAARRQITDTVPAKRFGDPAEFGAACAFLCSARSGFMTGQNLQLDGGAYAGLI